MNPEVCSCCSLYLHLCHGSYRDLCFGSYLQVYSSSCVLAVIWAWYYLELVSMQWQVSSFINAVTNAFLRVGWFTLGDEGLVDS